MPEGETRRQPANSTPREAKEITNMVDKLGSQTRRQFVSGTVTTFALATVAGPLGSSVALATPDKVAAEIKKLYGDKALASGKVKLDLPSIAENGLVVPLNFEVESPMTEKDYVKAVHFFADGNPNPQLADFYFTPMSPKAAGQIRIRLAKTQNIVAVAEMSDGKLYTAKKEVKV
ncbi:MAG: thiosulfate oxidation carrier protein SoxY, partial [Parvibaculaceae bacterium]